MSETKPRSVLEAMRELAEATQIPPEVRKRMDDDRANAEYTAWIRESAKNCDDDGARAILRQCADKIDDLHAALQRARKE